jgi:CheY-like chemotaxis protein
MNEPAASILVVDDDRTIRQNLVKLLKAEGYRPLEANEGEEALARIAADSPDAVLLDLSERSTAPSWLAGETALRPLNGSGSAVASSSTRSENTIFKSEDRTPIFARRSD